MEWKQSDIKMYGKTFKSPRLQEVMGDLYLEPSLYLKTAGVSWSPSMLTLKTRIETQLECQFDYVLMNLYRNGKDYISFHSDDEALDEGKRTIGSLSLGSERRFILRHKTKDLEKIEFRLTHGSLISMERKTQFHWKHGVPKMLRVKEPRINLTFRKS
eukprot:TRINITY_DN3857_c0_g1_i1.p1 TRINITY_DN3857_c0_g1~~TRINITY_DN3857_c0_g1_i1.p1  ORF type:complete len:158 (-),score=7.53 TRINITY_DN3857_c0_g1_i1:14-487(-)